MSVRYKFTTCLNIVGLLLTSLFSSCQFCLPRVEKDLFEREERAEAQQEILKKVARNLPVYTRTAGGGEAFTTAEKLTVVGLLFQHGNTLGDTHSATFLVVQRIQHIKQAT